jgi:hypothetical protein
MLRPSIQSRSAEPSFFYLIMAESCFQRAARTRRPNVRSTLRDIGRHYLAKANDVPQALDCTVGKGA